MKAILILAAIGVLSAPHSKPKSPDDIKQECMQACADRGNAELHKCGQVPECEKFVERSYNQCMKSCFADE
jgi:hypothetical protein